eukprot:6406462-Lingulodinium_polyedra.AAC.1
MCHRWRGPTRQASASGRGRSTVGVAVHPCRRPGTRAAAGPARALGPCAALAERCQSACLRCR